MRTNLLNGWNLVSIKAPILKEVNFGKMQLFPHFWVWLLNTIAIPPKSEDKYVEKVFNKCSTWQSCIFPKFTSFKIGTLKHCFNHEFTLVVAKLFLWHMCKIYSFFSILMDMKCYIKKCYRSPWWEYSSNDKICL